MKHFFLFLVVLSILLSPVLSVADDASREFRRGFTFEYRFASGWQHAALDDLPSDWESGSSFFQFGLGAFVNPDWAFGIKSTGLGSESRLFDSPRKIETIAELWSFSAQSWRLAPIKLEAGLGVSRFDSNARIVDQRDGQAFFDLDYGWGTYAAASVPLARRGAHRLELGFQWTYMSFEYQNVQQLAIQLGYQLF